ncbi:phage tail spike protein [Halalkalibacterium halodurans]|uniref:phage tail spike protein n=1 Tax=Halalkalibacterium halodurans TaxID=86665 RepID=UPI002E1FD2D4|nr:phage tail spike protein [Halalkalibacterium halodurans]MED4172556.1 phage tail spike protein [Halalkalibacterium halodurans]
MIHIVNPQTSEILDYITLDKIIEDTHKKSLESYIETYDAIVLGGDGFSYDKHLEKRNHIIIPDEDGTYQEFVLFEVDKYRDTEGRKTHFYAHATYLELKKAKVIYPTRREGLTASQHAGWALNDTGWTVGIVEAGGTRTFTIENHTNPYEFIKRLANEFEVEIRFRVEHDGRRITARYVDFLERVGEWRGREVEFGRDLDGIRRVEKQDIVTALLGLGPERDDGTRIEVLIEDEEALQRWGRVDEYGNLHHLIEPYEIQSDRQEMTEEEARQYTRTALDKRINTQVTYETTILDLEEVPGLEHEKIRFGDTIRIKDTYFNPPLYLEARVYEIERSIENKAKKDIKLGDFIEYTEEEVYAIWRQLRIQIQNKISLAQLQDYTYNKPQIDQKDQGVYQDGTVYTDERSNQVKQEAAQDATQKAGQAEQNAKDYADDAVREVEQRAVDFVQEYAEKKVTQGTAPPSDPALGDLWIDMNENPHMWRRWNGAEWEALERTNLDQMLGELQTEQIANGAIISDKLADLAVTLEKIADNAIDTYKILDGAIDAAKIAAGAVETDALAELSVTDDKIANIHADKITAGRINAARIQIGNGTEFADGYDPTKIEIGGRNLLEGDWNLTWADSHPSYQYLLRPQIQSILPKVKVGDVVTFSFDVEAESDTSLRIYDSNGHPGIRFGSHTLNIIQGKQRVTFTKTLVTGSSSSSTWYMDVYNNNNGVKFSISNLKIERGNKATDWTPAPEDQEAYADAVAQDGKDAKQRVALWQYEDTTFIDGGSIYANTVTANQIAAGTITADEIASNAITTAKINANAITTAKIAAGAVETDQLAANAVIADKIAANAVTTAKIAAGAVNADKIAAGTITSDLISTVGLDAGVIKFGTMSGERIQAGTITADQLGANSVTAAKIATNAVTSAKIEAGAVTASKISVNSLSAVSANLGNITAGNITGVNITGATITQTGDEGSITLDNTGFHKLDNQGRKRVSISNENWEFQGFSPASIVLNEEFGGTFLIGEGVSGYGDAYIGYIDGVTNRYFNLGNSGGRINLFADEIGLHAEDQTLVEIPEGTRMIGRGIGRGLHLGSEHLDHVIVSHTTGHQLMIYPQRVTGENIFTIRSHNQRSDYYDNFWIDSIGDTYTRGDLRVETGNIRGKGLWDITTSNSANARVGSPTSDGYSRILRSTSARKYKMFIEEADVDPYKILKLKPKSWIDKGEYIRNGHSTEGLKRHYGIIADEMEEIGLTEYVDYVNGEVENIVERAWTLLIPIVREQQQKIEKLEQEIALMKPD